MSGKSGENVTFCREIPDRDSGRVGETSICLSENKVTHVIACVVGADLSANSSLNHLDNHENFAAEAAPTINWVAGETHLSLSHLAQPHNQADKLGPFFKA